MSLYNYYDLKNYLNVNEIAKELDDYIEYVKKAKVTEQRFYVGIDEYIDYIMEYVDDKLDEVGFVNGNVESNGPEDDPLAAFWFNVYQSMHGLCYPLFDHHASTMERRENDILKLKCIKNTLLGIETEIGKIKGKVRKISDYSPMGTKGQIKCVWLATKEKMFYPE
jgi:hypothetical protein